MRSLVASAAALSALAAAPAGAACPTAADLEASGVLIEYSDGTSVRYHRLEPEIVSETTHTQDGADDYFTARFRGVFTVIDATLGAGGPDPETMLTFEPAEGSANLPAPAPSMAWAGEVVTRLSDGSVANEFRMRIEGGGEEELHISGCDYASVIVRVEEVYGDGDDSATELRYLPELDISYVAASGAVGRDYDSHYVPLAIGVAGEP